MPEHCAICPLCEATCGLKITVAGNPALSVPQSDRMVEALTSLDFMVSVGSYLNETTRFAQVILPPPGHLQRYHYDLAFAQLAIRNQARFSDRVFPLQPDPLDEWEIVLRLAGIVAGSPASVAQMDLLEIFNWRPPSCWRTRPD